MNRFGLGLIRVGEDVAAQLVKEAAQAANGQAPDPAAQGAADPAGSADNSGSADIVDFASVARAAAREAVQLFAPAAQAEPPPAPGPAPMGAGDIAGLITQVIKEELAQLAPPPPPPPPPAPLVTPDDVRKMVQQGFAELMQELRANGMLIATPAAPSTTTSAELAPSAADLSAAGADKSATA